MPQGTSQVVVQTDFEGNAQADCCMSRKAAKAIVQTDSMVTQDDEV